MNVRKLLCAAAALFLSLGAVPGAQAAVKCAWSNPSDAAHKVVTGYQTTLRGICDNPAADNYVWKDSTGAVVDTGVIGTWWDGITRLTYNIQSQPITINASMTYTLYVYDVAGASLGSDTYAVTAVSNTTTNLKDIAIDDGLWFLHASLVRYTTDAAHGSAPAAYDESNNYATPLSGQALVDAGFLITGSANNPYTETLQRLVNYITEHLGVMNFNTNPKGDGYDPENRSSTSVKDKMGVFFSNDYQGYHTQMGTPTALRFLSTVGYSRTSTAKPVAYNNGLNYSYPLSGDIRNWTYPQIMQQMVDFTVWSQLVNQANNYTTCVAWDARTASCTDFGVPPYQAPTKRAVALFPGSKGSWPYDGYSDGWKVDPTDPNNTIHSGNGTFGDVAISYWNVLGLQGAEKLLTTNGLGSGVVYPTYVKTDLTAFLNGRLNPVTGEFPYGPARNIHLVERAGAGLVMMQWVGISSSDAKVTAVKNFIKNNWSRNGYHHGQGWPDQNYICHDIDGREVQCYSHFELGGNPAGFWACNRDQSSGGYDNFGNWFGEDSGFYDAPVGPMYGGNWTCGFEVVETYDDMNVFAFKTVTEGLAAYAVTNFPAASPNDSKTIYRALLINNQAATGGWTDRGWINGSPAGSAWAIQALLKL